jgi:hypothetical protein
MSSGVEGHWRGLVFVNLDLDRTAPPLLEALGTTHEAQHDLACNWKTYAVAGRSRLPHPPVALVSTSTT